MRFTVVVRSMVGVKNKIEKEVFRNFSPKGTKFQIPRILLTGLHGALRPPCLHKLLQVQLVFN
jgi:hypothetical protein